MNPPQVILRLLLSVFLLANAASIAAADSSTPENVIEEFYRLFSFEAGSRPDYDRIRTLMTDDAIILIGAATENVELIDADESLRRIQQRIEDISMDEFGILAVPQSITCKTGDVTAYCMAVVRVEYPGLDAKPVYSNDLTTLEKREDRWLATSSTLFVRTPEVAPPSILSIPVKREGPELVKKRKWDRPLPFLAQKVIDLGYDLPNPFGVSVIPVVMHQDMVLSNLAISVNDGPVGDIDWVDFATPTVDSKTLQIKLDAWLFPFMNVFATVGWLDGGANVPVIIQGSDLMNHIGLGSRCDGGALQPDMCVKTLAAEVKPVYEGESFTLGATLATGWKSMFVAIPVSHTWTNLNDKDDNVESFNISPRIGVTSDIGSWGTLATYMGATYLDATNVIDDSITFDTSDSGVPELGNTTTVEYLVDQTNKDKWNYLIGFSWSFTKEWSVHAEAGFGGSRSNFISSATYRF